MLLLNLLYIVSATNHLKYPNLDKSSRRATNLKKILIWVDFCIFSHSN